MQPVAGNEPELAYGGFGLRLTLVWGLVLNGSLWSYLSITGDLDFGGLVLQSRCTLHIFVRALDLVKVRLDVRSSTNDIRPWSQTFGWCHSQL